MPAPIMIATGKDVRPAEDYGFFGPDSVTWRVWSYPTSLTVGFQSRIRTAATTGRGHAPPMPAPLRPVAKIVAGWLRAATLATMPRWMREMAGLRRSRIADMPIRPLMRQARRRPPGASLSRPAPPT